MIEGATKDKQSITADWVFTQELIDGVRVREVKNVPVMYGVLTEVFRRDWALEEGTVDQVFQVTLFPGAVLAWHAHQLTTDRLFVNPRPDQVGALRRSGGVAHVRPDQRLSFRLVAPRANRGAAGGVARLPEHFQ